ncbi:MAG: hypothetical protein VYC34_02245, partial [Planctomycetota bacterium]|nr:hypothetical protein [Planctomycetota bacterium]
EEREMGPLATLHAAGLDGAGTVVELNGRRWSVRMHDEAGLLNVNKAEEEQLRRYFEQIGVDPSRAVEITHQILDWRDDDDFVRPRGAEATEYDRRGVVIRNGSLVSLDELLYLPAMDRDIFDRMRRSTTLIGDGEIHAPTAPREVIASAPGVTEATVERIIALRRGGALTRDALEDALLGFGRESVKLFRFDPTSYVRIRVTSLDRRLPDFEAVAIVDDERGVRIGQFTTVPSAQSAARTE